jgi:hypothetical protein
MEQKKNRNGDNMDRFSELMQKCKCTIILTINEHRNYYQTVEQFFNEVWHQDDVKHISSEILQKMKDTNTIIELQFYSETPIGAYKIYDYNLNSAIERACNC